MFAIRTARRGSPPRPASGFTLVELMVTVVIASVLVSIALPAYMSSIRKSRRTEAKSALLDLAGREERYFNTPASNGTYTTSAAALGYAPTGSAATITNFAVGSGYYQVTIVVPSPTAGAPAASYQISATPLTADQLKDAQCLLFTLDYTGLQTATNAACWN